MLRGHWVKFCIRCPTRHSHREVFRSCPWTHKSGGCFGSAVSQLKLAVVLTTKVGRQQFDTLLLSWCQAIKLSFLLSFTIAPACMFLTACVASSVGKQAAVRWLKGGCIVSIFRGGDTALILHASVRPLCMHLYIFFIHHKLQ